MNFLGTSSTMESTITTLPSEVAFMKNFQTLAITVCNVSFVVNNTNLPLNHRFVEVKTIPIECHGVSTQPGIIGSMLILQIVHNNLLHTHQHVIVQLATLKEVSTFIPIGSIYIETRYRCFQKGSMCGVQPKLNCIYSFNQQCRW